MIYASFTVVVLLLFLARRERMKYLKLRDSGRVTEIVNAQRKSGTFLHLAIL